MRINLYKYCLALIFSIFVLSFQSCKEKNYTYLTLINKSDKTIIITTFTTIGGMVINETNNGIKLSPQSSESRIYRGYGYVFEADEGMKVVIIEIPECPHDKNYEFAQSKTEFEGVVMYYSIEELRAMDWTIVYDGNME